MKAQDIRDAWAKIRKIDNTIPDEVLDFMKDCAIDVLEENEKEENKRLIYQGRVLRLKQYIEQERKDLNYENIYIGSWTCPSSPISVCAYDNFNDPAQDDCIFCGQPDERK